MRCRIAGSERERKGRRGRSGGQKEWTVSGDREAEEEGKRLGVKGRMVGHRFY